MIANEPKVTFINRWQQRLHQRNWVIFSLCMAAIFGGYALATSMALLIGQILGLVMDGNEATHSGFLLAFIIYACAAMWVFSGVSAKQAWLDLLKLSLGCAGLTWVLIQVNS